MASSTAPLPLQPARLGVVEQLRYSRRDVAAEHVNRADRGRFGGVVVLAELVRRPHRAVQSATNKAHPQAADLGHLAIEHMHARAGELRP